MIGINILQCFIGIALSHTGKKLRIVNLILGWLLALGAATLVAGRFANIAGLTDVILRYSGIINIVLAGICVYTLILLVFKIIDIHKSR